MSNNSKEKAELCQEIEKIDREILVLENSIGEINEVCGTNDARELISFSRFLDSIPVLQERIEKLKRLKKDIIAKLNEIIGVQATVIEA